MYGFLGGVTVEKEGTPNVGLWDQRAALEWIQKYIPDIGGNKDEITAMGISAGAGSILHHLTAEGGKKDPIFRRAIIQSPGYATVQDRAGDVENKFHRIAEMLECKGKGLDCMRAVSEVQLRNVSEALNSAFAPGKSGWDPIVDTKYVLDTPTLEIAAGRFGHFMSNETNMYRAILQGLWFYYQWWHTR